MHSPLQVIPSAIDSSVSTLLIHVLDLHNRRSRAYGTGRPRPRPRPRAGARPQRSRYTAARQGGVPTGRHVTKDISAAAHKISRDRPAPRRLRSTRRAGAVDDSWRRVGEFIASGTESRRTSGSRPRGGRDESGLRRRRRRRHIRAADDWITDAVDARLARQFVADVARTVNELPRRDSGIWSQRRRWDAGAVWTIGTPAGYPNATADCARTQRGGGYSRSRGGVGGRGSRETRLIVRVKGGWWRIRRSGKRLGARDARRERRRRYRGERVVH